MKIPTYYFEFKDRKVKFHMFSTKSSELKGNVKSYFNFSISLSSRLGDAWVEIHRQLADEFIKINPLSD